MEIPEFRLYGQGRPEVEQAIQPTLALRDWGELHDDQKRTIIRQLYNKGWLKEYSRELLGTILHMNDEFLRECPGKNLHKIVPYRGHETYSSNESERMKAALADFEQILLERPDAMVLRMLSVFASCYIDRHDLSVARQTKSAAERKKAVDRAFEKFDPLANCLNHIFEQFAVNQLVTRSGFVPRQDAAITTEVYVPTLEALADPRWKPVSDDLAAAFQDYREKNFSEAITKVHAAVQRFLQTLAGEEGKSGRGEIGKLFQRAKDEGLIPVNRFTEPLINASVAYIVSERATNSTAKPSLTEATAADALLVLNTVMILLQFCLQEQH